MEGNIIYLKVAQFKYKKVYYAYIFKIIYLFDSKCQLRIVVSLSLNLSLNLNKHQLTLFIVSLILSLNMNYFRFNLKALFR